MKKCHLVPKKQSSCSSSFSSSYSLSSNDVSFCSSVGPHFPTDEIRQLSSFYPLWSVQRTSQGSCKQTEKVSNRNVVRNLFFFCQFLLSLVIGCVKKALTNQLWPLIASFPRGWETANHNLVYATFRFISVEYIFLALFTACIFSRFCNRCLFWSLITLSKT